MEENVRGIGRRKLQKQSRGKIDTFPELLMDALDLTLMSELGPVT